MCFYLYKIEIKTNSMKSKTGTGPLVSISFSAIVMGYHGKKLYYTSITTPGHDRGGALPMDMWMRMPIGSGEWGMGTGPLFSADHVC